MRGYARVKSVANPGETERQAPEAVFLVVRDPSMNEL